MNRNHSNVSGEVGSIERQTATLVDDDANYRQVLGEALTENGWDVIDAATGENALMLDVESAYKFGSRNGWVESWSACQEPMARRGAALYQRSKSA